jgi:probable phosphoglycerate mutase
MKLYVARHGRTNYNDLGLCNGDPTVDVHLTEAGIEQAKALAEKLKDVQFDQIFISEHKRTRQTADIANEYHHAPIAVDTRLNDNRNGFEGKHREEYYSALEKAEDKWTARFNDGESIEDIRKRVASFLAELKARDYQTVLIVTSQVIAQALCGIIRGLSYEEAMEIEVSQGSCTELDLN